MSTVMRNLDDETLGQKVIIKREVPFIQDAVTMRPVTAKPELTKADENWEWYDLRDYVVTQIESRHGGFERNVLTESGIFKSFLKRWGGNSPSIARAAFDIYQGYWMGHPVTVSRFCKASDPFFSRVIAERLGIEK